VKIKVLLGENYITGMKINRFNLHFHTKARSFIETRKYSRKLMQDTHNFGRKISASVAPETVHTDENSSTIDMLL
jgi:hypothetical protein